MFNYFIRTSGEIFTKGKATRAQILKVLTKNIKATIKNKALFEELDIQFKIKHDMYHYEVESSHDLTEEFMHLPGISSFSPSIKLETTSYDELLETAKKHFAPLLKGKRFSVRCKSTLKSHSASKVNIDLGSMLIEHSDGVNLKHPDICCQLIIRPKFTFIYTKKIMGTEGFPVNAGGRTLTLFSGGIDSPIAAWQMYKKGVGQDYVYFDLGGETQKTMALDLVQKMHRKFASGSKSSVLIVPFQEVISKLMKIDQPFQNLGLKVCFYKAAEMLAHKINVQSLVTGESLGQVSTQTLSNLSSLDQTIDMFVLRPILCHTKTEIMHKAQELKIFDLTYQGEEFCALSKKNVKTKSTKASILNALEGFDFSILDQAIKDVWGIPLHRPEHWTYFKPESKKIVYNEKLLTIKIDENIDNEIQNGNVKRMTFKEAQNDCLHWSKDFHYHIVCPLGQKSYYIKQLMAENDFNVEAYDEVEYKDVIYLSN